jgi:hypothetical protein
LDFCGGLGSEISCDGRHKNARAARPRRAHDASDAIVVGNAGWIIGQYGLILAGLLQGKFTVDYFPRAEELLGRAHEFDRKSPMYPGALEQLRKLRDASRRPN